MDNKRKKRCSSFLFIRERQMKPSVQLSSVAQSCPTLQPHESQHYRPTGAARIKQAVFGTKCWWEWKTDLSHGESEHTRSTLENSLAVSRKIQCVYILGTSDWFQGVFLGERIRIFRKTCSKIFTEFYLLRTEKNSSINRRTDKTIHCMEHNTKLKRKRISYWYTQ